MKLCELFELDGVFYKIYCVLKHRLPPVEEIEVYELKELHRFGFVPRQTVLACALKPNRLFFAEIPPDPHTFAHELIHLCEKPDHVSEEVYASNLSSVVVFCARENIDADVIALFDLTIDQINEVLRKFGYKDIEDYYIMQGVIPFTHELVYEEEKISLKRDERYTDTDIVIAFVAELSAGADYFEHCKQILIELLDLCKP